MTRSSTAQSLPKSTTSLKSRLAGGSIHLVIGNLTEQGGRFLRNMILARILAPEYFGAMAMVIAVNNLIETFTDIGIRYAIIQSKHNDNDIYMHMAWFASVIRATFICLVGYFLAPSIAIFYKDSTLTPLIRIALLSVLFNGAISLNYHLALKNFQTRSWVIITNGGGILGVAATVIIGYYYRSPYALVIGLVLESLFRFILSFIITPYMPVFKFDQQAYDELKSFSKGMLGLGIFYYIFIQSDVLFVGKLCSAYELGVYSMAVSLAQVPFQMVGQLIDKLGMPAFSEMQDDHHRINNNIFRMLAVISISGLPVISYLLIYSNQLLKLIYGDAYAIAGRAMAIITLTFLLRLMAVPIGQVYYSTGQPGLNRNFTVYRAILILLLLYPFIMLMGLEGAALAGLLAMGIGLFVQVMKLKTITSFNPGSCVKPFAVAISISLGLLGILYVFSKYTPNTISSFAISVPLFGALYAFVNYRVYYKTNSILKYEF
jgi:PST family polysaccharide transporter